MKKKVLITGFEPFENYTLNPSYEAIKNLPDMINGTSIIKMEVPSVFRESTSQVIKKIESERPDIIILVGQAGDRAHIAVERVAINIDDARIPDNKGNQPIDTYVVENDLPAYFATLPVKAIVAAIEQKGIPTQISNSAGTYVCNHLMFGVLSYINNRKPDMKCGFIHVPIVTEQAKPSDVNEPLLSLADITSALTEAIEVSLTVEKDIKETGGMEF